MELLSIKSIDEADKIKGDVNVWFGLIMRTKI